MPKDKARERETDKYSGHTRPQWDRPATQSEIVANAEAVKAKVLGPKK